MSNIEQLIPHRAPFLFVDKIIDQTEHSIITQKEITGKESFFQGHFPENPIMPGVLMTEALLQTGAILMSQRGLSSEQKTPVVTRINNVKFKKILTPPATMIMDVTCTQNLENVSYFKGKIKVHDKLILSCEFSCALLDNTRA